ncbi:MAG: WecB/TagA/CpsF family glycosyltransferase [Longimicrobiales bacterium]
MDEAVERIAAVIQERAGCAEQRRMARVCVVNANKAWQARRDAELRRVLERAELLVSEYATAWAARRLGLDGVRNIGGIRLLVRLLREAEARGWSVYFLGARQAVLGAMLGRLGHTHPGLRVVGARDGYWGGRRGGGAGFEGAEWARVVAELERVAPDLLFVGMGSPLQERVIGRLPAAAAGVAMGVGGSFDVLAGVRRDAPEWARGNGLEWLYRLAQDPRRLWRRYLVTNTWVVWSVARERLVPRLAVERARGSPRP